jgi:hypothetical protein
MSSHGFPLAYGSPASIAALFHIHSIREKEHEERPQRYSNDHVRSKAFIKAEAHHYKVVTIFFDIFNVFYKLPV